MKKERENSGLSLLSPFPRFVLVFLASTLFVLITTFPWALALFSLGFVLFLLGEKKDWKLILSIPVSGGLMLFYNTILSPQEAGGIQILFLTINVVGFERGLVRALRLMGIMFISFAWLFATPIPEMYEGVAFLGPAKEWTLGILRGIQILKREFVALTQSLIIRGLAWDSLGKNIKNLVPLATAIIPRVIDNAQKATYASQSHKQSGAKRDGKLQVEQLFVRYSPELSDVLKEITLEVQEGEFVYLAGKGKAGKSTLLRVAGGVIPWIMGEFKGRVKVASMLTHKVSLAELCGSVRYVAPDPFASIYGLTVGQEISFLAENERQARQALEVMGLAKFWERETTKLSGGQQARLVLAGVLACQADILLLDSPMQELDPEGRVDFLQGLKLLRAGKKGTIIVEDPFYQEFEGDVDRVIVLEEGRLTADLSSKAFFRKEWITRCHLEKIVPPRIQMSSGEIVARMKGVEVSLEGNKILKGIDFELAQGELVAITGPNGSGKTTAMLTLAGAISPEKGECWTKGRVGYVFQHAALQILSMTVKEELAFGPKVLGWREEKVRSFVNQGLVWTGLDALDYPLDLHPAQIRLLTIAAMKTDVSTLVFDEPTLGLDSVGIAKVVRLINRLRIEGKGVVVITHDEAVASLADKVVIIKNGTLI